MIKSAIGYGVCGLTNFAFSVAIVTVTVIGPALAEPGVTDTRIRLGQSVPLSGPLQELGRECVQGANVYFQAVNERGGIYGRKIELISKDDGYVVDRTLSNANDLLTQGDGVFAFFKMVGTANNMALMPLLDKNGVPSIAPYSGADSLREFNRYVFHVRASYGDEAEQLVRQLVSLGLTRIAAFYQDDPFGKSALAGAETALKKRDMALVAKGSFEKNTINVAAAAKTIGAANPQAVLLLSTYKPTIAFLREMKKTGYNTQFYALSVVGFKQLVDDLGPDARGIGISQVMPYPWSATTPVVGEYLKALTRYAPDTPNSYSAVECYIDAKLLVEGLKVAGPQLTRKKFISALESFKDHDLGGISVGYSATSHKGSSYVDTTIVAKTGKLIR